MINDRIMLNLSLKNQDQEAAYSTADLKAVRGVYWSDLCNI